MEQLNVFDCSNVLIASFFTDDRGCAHENREHTLIYLCSGKLEIEECGRKTVLHAGECAFMRRDNRMWLQKHADAEHPYRSVVLKFTKPFLREFYRTLDRKEIPLESKRERVSLRVLPNNRPDIRSLFESVVPYFDAGVQPSDDVLKLKMIEGAYVLLNTDKNLYASLFDFAKVSDLTPQKWLIKRRLEAAHGLIKSGKKRVTEACFDVGFKNLSHFSKVYKETYGYAPSMI